MKKVIGITIAVFMLTGNLVGCGNSDTEKSKTATATSIETQAETEETVETLEKVIERTKEEDKDVLIRIIKIVFKEKLGEDEVERLVNKIEEGRKKEVLAVVDMIRRENQMYIEIGKKEGKYLEQYFDAEIAPLISPIVVGKRQPFPFLKNKGIYAVVVLEKKNGKEKSVFF